MSSSRGRGTAGPDPLAPFVPRRVRRTAVVLAVVVGVGLAGLFVGVSSNAATQIDVDDQLGFVLLAAFLWAVLWRQAGVRAVPDPDGLTVRNLLLSRRVDWTQIVSVRYGPDRAWAQLDLDDGDTLAVMAIQRADGDRAAREASRLASLVGRFGEPPEPSRR